MIALSELAKQSGWQVLGVGSPHGDDQVGWHVVKALRCRGVEQAVAVRDPSQLLDHMSKDCRAVIVDACDGGDVPGTVYRAVWPNLPVGERRFGSSHHLDVGQALKLAERLGRLPSEVVLLGIGANCFSRGDEMCAAVRGAVDVAVELVLRELSRATGGCHA